MTKRRHGFKLFVSIAIFAICMTSLPKGAEARDLLFVRINGQLSGDADGGDDNISVVSHAVIKLVDDEVIKAIGRARVKNAKDKRFRGAKLGISVLSRHDDSAYVEFDEDGEVSRIELTFRPIRGAFAPVHLSVERSRSDDSALLNLTVVGGEELAGRDLATEILNTRLLPLD